MSDQKIPGPFNFRRFYKTNGAKLSCGIRTHVPGTSVRVRRTKKSKLPYHKIRPLYFNIINDNFDQKHNLLIIFISHYLFILFLDLIQTSLSRETVPVEHSRCNCIVLPKIYTIYSRIVCQGQGYVLLLLLEWYV